MPSWFGPHLFNLVGRFKGWLGATLVPFAILACASAIIFIFASVPIHRIPPLWGPWMALAAECCGMLRNRTELAAASLRNVVAATFRTIPCCVSQGRRPLRGEIESPPTGSASTAREIQSPRAWWRRVLIPLLPLLPLLPLPIALGVLHRGGGTRLSGELRAIAKCVVAVDWSGADAASDAACEDLRALIPADKWDPYTGCKPSYSAIAYRQCNALRVLMLKPTETDVQCTVTLFSAANNWQDKTTCGARAAWVLDNTERDWGQALDMVATEFPKECGQLASEGGVDNEGLLADGAGRCVGDLIRFVSDALSKPSAADPCTEALGQLASMSGGGNETGGGTQPVPNMAGGTQSIRRSLGFDKNPRNGQRHDQRHDQQHDQQHDQHHLPSTRRLGGLHRGPSNVPHGLPHRCRSLATPPLATAR